MTSGNKHWINEASACLKQSLNPLPHETNEIDFKVQLSENSQRLIEHLIAFSNNANGGYLVFGIQDSTGIIGVTKEEADPIVTKLCNLGRDGIEPALVLDHAIVDWDGTPLLIIRIPEIIHKPAHRRGGTIAESWIRSAGTTRKATRQEIGALMLNSHAPKWEQLRASELMNIEAVLASLDTAAIANLLQRPLPEDQTELINWLVAEGVLIKDGRGFYVTNFGAIAAAYRLEEFPSLERKRIRVIRYQGTNKITTIDEMMGVKGYAVGFEGLIAYIHRNLPHSEVIQQSLRQRVSLYPELALRELIANALIHQDFNVTGAGPMIEIFEDRIEFTNPGTLLPGKPVDRLIGTTPQSRNELLASSFRRYRICEERGTGFQKVVNQIELFGLPPLKFLVGDNSFKIVLSAPRKFGEMSQEERIEATYQHAILQYLSSKTLTNSTLRERFKLHEKHRNQISGLITDAVDSNRIKRKDLQGGNKFAEYIPYWA